MITPELFTIEMRRFLDDIDANMDKQTFMSYYERLSEELDDEEFLRAIDRLGKEWKPYGRDYPTKLEFIRAAELSDDEIEEAASLAYQLAKKIAINQGCYVSPDFDDLIIADVINEKFGGWFEFHNEVAYVNSDDTWAKRDFIDTYKRKARNKKAKRTKLIGYGNSPRPLKIACNYNIPVKVINSPAIENKTSTLVKSLANAKRM